jgi:hypothetical protein
MNLVCWVAGFFAGICVGGTIEYHRQRLSKQPRNSLGRFIAKEKK